MVCTCPGVQILPEQKMTNLIEELQQLTKEPTNDELVLQIEGMEKGNAELDVQIKTLTEASSTTSLDVGQLSKFKKELERVQKIYKQRKKNVGEVFTSDNRNLILTVILLQTSFMILKHC